MLHTFLNLLHSITQVMHKLSTRSTFCFALAAFLFSGCGTPSPADGTSENDWSPIVSESKGASASDADGFVWQTEQFADLKIVRYQVGGWDKLDNRQKALVYCLNQAGLSGRDIMYDQNNRYNLRVRNLLENIYTGFDGDKNTVGWNRFETYLKRIWFSNGIHHHYANTKLLPEFSEAYFDELLAATEEL